MDMNTAGLISDGPTVSKLADNLLYIRNIRVSADGTYHLHLVFVIGNSTFAFYFYTII